MKKYREVIARRMRIDDTSVKGNPRLQPKSNRESGNFLRAQDPN